MSFRKKLIIGGSKSPKKDDKPISILPTFKPDDKPKIDYSKAVFDPMDKGVELSLIKLNIEGKEMTFLLGRSNNLYSNEKENELMGKIEIIDDKKCNVYLCEGWRDKLKDV